MKRTPLLLLAFLLLALRLDAANLVSTADGNWTTAATWAPAANYQGTDGNSTGLSTTYQYSPVFTITSGQVVDGVMLRCNVGGATGSMDVALSADSGTTATRSVTVSLSALYTGAANWTQYFFKFTSSETSSGGTTYAIGLRVASGSSSVSCARDTTAGNWFRAVRRSDTTQAPAAGDTLIVVGEWSGGTTSTTRTVTMDNNDTTAFGEVRVGSGGTLAYTTSASTQLRLAGNLVVSHNATFTIGTSGAPIPRGTTAILEWSNASDGQYGGILEAGSTFRIYGQSPTAGKAVPYTYLTANITAGGSAPQTWSVLDDTGWKAGDEVLIASTSRTYSQYETRILNADAGASSFDVTVAATNAHSGTTPTRAEVAHLTRNVLIQASTSTNVFYINARATSTVDVEWASFRYGGVNNTVPKRGAFETTGAPTSFSVRYSVFRDNEAAAIEHDSSANNITLSYNVFTQSAWGFGLWRVESFGGTNVTLDHNLAIGSSGSGAGFAWAGGRGDITFTNNTAASINSRGVYATFGGLASLSAAQWSGNTAHSNNDTGFELQSSGSSFLTNSTIANLTTWRNGGGGGLYLNVGNSNLTFDGLVAFGNNTYNTRTPGGWGLTFKNCSLSGDSSFSTTWGHSYINNPQLTELTIDNCDIGIASGIKTTHTGGDIETWGSAGQVSRFTFRNSRFGSTNLFTNTANIATGSLVRYQQHQQTANNHKAEYYCTTGAKGVIALDTTTFDVTPSVKLTPATTACKLDSAAAQNGQGFITPVDSGQTVTVHIKVRKDASYNGAAPRLLVQANSALGITADTVLATCTVSDSAWTDCTGTTSAVTATGVLSFVIDCDGTAGSIYIDTGSVDSPVAFDGSYKYWRDGLPSGGQKVGTLASAGYSYWSDGPRAWGTFSGTAPVGGGGSGGGLGFPALFLHP